MFAGQPLKCCQPGILRRLLEGERGAPLDLFDKLGGIVLRRPLSSHRSNDDERKNM